MALLSPILKSQQFGNKNFLLRFENLADLKRGYLWFVIPRGNMLVLGCKNTGTWLPGPAENMPMRRKSGLTRGFTRDVDFYKTRSVYKTGATRWGDGEWGRHHLPQISSTNKLAWR